MARIADRITVLHRGRVIGSLPPGGTDLERLFFEMVYAAEGVTDEEVLAGARSDIDGPLAAKIAPMLQGTGWTGLMGFVGQILSIGMLLAVGVVVSWSFGREFTDGTFGSLFALPTPRRDVATAKIVVLVHWGLDVAVAAVALTLVLGMATGLG